MSLYDESSPYVYTPSYTYPDNMGAANVAFNIKDAYKNEPIVKTLSTEGGTVRIGFSKSAKVDIDWTCLDNVRLYYRPLGTDIVEVKNEKTSSKDIYDLSGRKVVNPTKGIYIINGQVQLIK